MLGLTAQLYPPTSLCLPLLRCPSPLRNPGLQHTSAKLCLWPCYPTPHLPALHTLPWSLCCVLHKPTNILILTATIPFAYVKTLPSRPPPKTTLPILATHRTQQISTPTFQHSLPQMSLLLPEFLPPFSLNLQVKPEPTPFSVRNVSLSFA